VEAIEGKDVSFYGHEKRGGRYWKFNGLEL
jgi:hypothetical protein